MRILRRPTGGGDQPAPPAIRFYNQAAADDRVFRDRIVGQVYDPEKQGYGADMTLQGLFSQAENDPALAAQLSKMFMLSGADQRAFEKQFTDDVDFARMYADVEGKRGEGQTYKTIAPKYRGDRSLPDNTGEKGCGANMACDPKLAMKVAKGRKAKGATLKDKVLARAEAALALSDAPEFKRTAYEGIYDRYGGQYANEYKNQAAMSLADGSVNKLMMMLGGMPGQGSRMYIPADRVASTPSYSMYAQ